jgi:iron complex outermembrane receptor protein
MAWEYLEFFFAAKLGRSNSPHTFVFIIVAMPKFFHCLLWIVLGVVSATFVRVPSAYGAPQSATSDLKRLTIEELMEIDVTSTSRRAEPVGTVAAAVSVITSDDIRRAGVTTIADALALADGVHVARFNNGSWSISARGFNGSTPNKLLVMVDGRTVYSPLFSGVFWNTLDYVLEDIDRIEVIRGPGATLWGANAVNGVVNILTRHSRDTRGTYLNVSAGNEDRAVAEARVGGGRGDTTWRVYGKVADRDDQVFSTGGGSQDGRRRGQAGFRLDGGDSQGPTWTLLGDAFHSRDELPARTPGEFTDLSLQGRVSLPVSGTSRVDVQSYYRREYRRVPQQLTHGIDMFDVDAQQSLTGGTRHTAVWGGGVRSNRDRTFGSAVFQFTPERRSYPVFNAFVQDEIALRPQRAYLTAGIKYEHNAFSGGELQPNVRARLLMPRSQVVWGAVSHAVRRPTRFDDDLEVLGTGGVVLIQGSGDFESESLVATELGYRIQPLPIVSLDATLFVHRFSDLRSQEAPPAGVIPITLGNTLQGQSHGVEVGVNLQPVTWWRTHVGYTWLDTSIERAAGSRDVSNGVSEMNDPNYLFGFRTSLDLPREMELDIMVRAVDDLPDPAVPSYSEMNLRLGWRATPRIDVWIVGQDLLHGHHPEFGTAVPRRVEFERGIRVGTTLRY